MIKTIAATALALTALTATTASAFTCKNTIETINGEAVYTFSQCTGQEPASQVVLDMMTESAKDRGPDADE